MSDSHADTIREALSRLLQKESASALVALDALVAELAEARVVVDDLIEMKHNETGALEAERDLLLHYKMDCERAIAAKNRAEAALAEARRERDEAIAHDRQPYPTAWAYEQACKALTAAEESNARLTEALDLGRRFVEAHDKFLAHQTPELAFAMQKHVDAFRAALAAGTDADG